MATTAVARCCKGTNKAGAPCGSRPLRGKDFCFAHDEESKASGRFGGPEHGKLGGRPRRPREIELIQQVAEEKKAQLRAVYVDGLEADRAVVVGNGPSAHVEHVADHPHRLRTAESILDRLHGKPATTIDANVQQHTLQVNLDASDPDTRGLIADLLRRRPASASDSIAG